MDFAYLGKIFSAITKKTNLLTLPCGEMLKLKRAGSWKAGISLVAAMIAALLLLSLGARIIQSQVLVESAYYADGWLGKNNLY